MYDPGKKGIEKTKRRGKAFRQIEKEKPAIHKRQEEVTNCLYRFFFLIRVGVKDSLVYLFCRL